MTVTTVQDVGVARHPITWSALETLTQSTATAIQTLNNNFEISVLGMGTATGFARNRYLLSTVGAAEGMEKLIIANATGEAYLILNNVGPTSGGTFNLNCAAALLLAATTVDALQAIATATGNLVFGAADDQVRVKFMGGLWRCVDLYGATLATTT